jgi:hypothetical protein
VRHNPSTLWGTSKFDMTLDELGLTKRTSSTQQLKIELVSDSARRARSWIALSYVLRAVKVRPGSRRSRARFRRDLVCGHVMCTLHAQESIQAAVQCRMAVRLHLVVAYRDVETLTLWIIRCDVDQAVRSLPKINRHRDRARRFAGFTLRPPSAGPGHIRMIAAVKGAFPRKDPFQLADRALKS